MAADLKSSVGIVSPEYTDEQTDKMSDFALELSRMNIPTLSRQLSQYTKHISGSAVVVTHPETGAKVAITNRHVVCYATTATLEFSQGKQTHTYHNCPILGYSPTTDLAFVLLPADADNPALMMDTIRPTDGTDIVAAGYPGLNGKPSWQLTKGSVSNSELYDSDLLKDGETAIQHTAAIDPGSSGGPLLTAHNDTFRIVGINTWGVRFRASVGIAIPTVDILRMLQAPSDIEPLDSICPLTADQWKHHVANIPTDTLERWKKDNYDHPLEFIQRVTDYTHQHAIRQDKKGNIHTKRLVSVTRNGAYQMYGIGCNNFLSAHNWSALAIGEFSWTGFGMLGAQIGGRAQDLVSSDQSNPIGGFCINIYTGLQIPIQIGEFTLLPRITLGGGMGLLGKAHNDILYAPDALGTAGLAFRFPVGDIHMQAGVHYTYDMLFGVMTDYIPHFFGQHGLGFHLTVVL